MLSLTCRTAGAGMGRISGSCGRVDMSSGQFAGMWAAPQGGSILGGGSCVGDSSSNPIALTSSTMVIAGITYTLFNFNMPAENVTCTATFNLNTPPPPINASVESGLALSLTFLGIVAMAGFKKWRNKT